MVIWKTYKVKAITATPRKINRDKFRGSTLRNTFDTSRHTREIDVFSLLIEAHRTFLTGLESLKCFPLQFRTIQKFVQINRYWTAKMEYDSVFVFSESF